MRDLTPRQREFVRHYLATSNGTQSAIQAGYSKHTAAEQASRLLKSVRVAQAVAAGLADSGDTQGTIIDELRTVGSDAAAAGQYGPAVRAIELRGKHLGMWQEVQGRNQSKITINIFDSSVDIGGSQDSHSGTDADVIQGELANPDAE